MEDDDFSLLPIYITTKVLAKLEDCTPTTARERFKTIRKVLGLSRSQKLTWPKYCDYRKITGKEAINRYLRVLIAVATISVTLAFAKMAMEYSCEFFRKHKMIYDEQTPTHIKAHTFIYDPQTKRMEKTTITIDKIK